MAEDFLSHNLPAADSALTRAGWQQIHTNLLGIVACWERLQALLPSNHLCDKLYK